MQTGLHVGLDDDNFSDFVVGDGSGFIATMDNYTFAGRTELCSIAYSAPWGLCVAHCAAMLCVWSSHAACVELARQRLCQQRSLAQ